MEVCDGVPGLVDRLKDVVKLLCLAGHETLEPAAGVRAPATLHLHRPIKEYNLTPVRQQGDNTEITTGVYGQPSIRLHLPVD